MKTIAAWALLAVHSTSAISIAPSLPRVPRLQPQLHMSAGSEDSKVDILAARDDGRRVAVSGLQPQQQASEQYVGVPPPGQFDAPPSFVQRARAPFMGLTLLATAAVAAWQSNRMYKQRQQGLLADFGATMIFHLGDENEMASAIKDFRAQLGPGKYRGQMFQSFLIALANDIPIGLSAISNTKTVMSLMRIQDSAAAQVLESVAVELQKQPSVLGKLTFVAERAMPMASSMAKLRTRFPNWSLDTVTALQRAMLENLYRELCEELPAGKLADSETLQMLGLSETDANRLMQEVQEKMAAAEAAALAEQEERERAEQLQRALEAASALSTDANDTPTSDDDASKDGDAPAVTGAAGTHEYECTKCGYVLFPAAGRETKFFGDGFVCPQCGASKSAFVDNGPV